MDLEDFGLPCFIDVEASGFGPDSYPIEVAWSNPTGAIDRCLIDVSQVPSWQHWNPESEAIHGIDQERLRRNGWDPDYVAARLREDLEGEIVYSDAPEFDKAWLERLYTEVGETLPFRLMHVEELLLPLVRQPDDMIYQAVQRLDQLKEEISGGRSGRHAAGYDVGYLIQLWQRAQGRAAKMNHGVGPLPKMTDTGSFQRLKLGGSEHSEASNGTADL